jgi:hypothetical protein
VIPTTAARIGLWHQLAATVAVALVVVGCGTSQESPTAKASPAAEGIAWARAADIAQPEGFMTVHTDASGQPYTRGCAPCHPAIDTVMSDVVAGPAGLVAAGWILQDFMGATWSSRDGSTWTFNGDLGTESILSAVAANDSRYVAVGRDGKGGTAWSSTDGASWVRTGSTEAFADTPLRPTSVVRWHDGFAAGGYRGSEFFSADGAFWISPDGLTWQRASDSGDLHDARVVSLTAGGPGLVAVGQAGPADRPGPVVVWTSTDGLAWHRIPDAALFHDARVRSVAVVPGIGLVAVGDSLNGNSGVVWTSSDGLAWARVPDSAVFGRPGIQVRMYDVTAGPHGAVAVGTVTAGIQYGEAAVWTSADGKSWTRLPDGPEFLDTEINGATIWDGRIVAVGDRGAPDAYQATAWLSPPDVGR